VIDFEPVKLDSAKQLDLIRCEPSHAVALNKLWHSRLPEVQTGPWMYAFRFSYQGLSYAVALWNNPSARTLPSHWVELRRMACAPYAPKYTPSRFLSLMVRWFTAHRREHEVCISYQDPAVHKGTIYKAAGWEKVHEASDRTRDRSKPRRGTTRLYRKNSNSDQVDGVGKVRWEKRLR